MVKRLSGSESGVSPRSGRPWGGEAVAMLAAVAGIVTAQRFGLWPQALQGAAGVIVQAIVVLLPAFPRGLRWSVNRLRRRGRGRTTAIEVPHGAGIDGEASVAGRDPGAPPVSQSSKREGPAAAIAPPPDAFDIGELAETADFLAGYLPDPTMWPSWPPVADNDDAAGRDADDEVEPTAV